MKTTLKHLDNKINTINDLLGKKKGSHTKVNEKYSVNIGSWTLGHQLGGYSVEVAVNEGGGISCPLGYGRYPAGNMGDILDAVIVGIRAGKEIAK